MSQSDKNLRAAARDAGDIILASYFADSEPDHQFSQEFDRKMELLIQQTKKRSQYTILQKVASVILAIALSGGLWLAINTEARAAVFGWVKEQYENIFQYHFEGDTDFTSAQNYELGWLPEGYRFVRWIDGDGTTNVFYTDKSGNIISLLYTTDLNDTSLDLFVLDDSATLQTVMIGELSADLYITNDAEQSNAIAWEDAETNGLFIISSTEDGDVLIKMAENIVSTKK